MKCLRKSEAVILSGAVLELISARWLRCGYECSGVDIWKKCLLPAALRAYTVFGPLYSRFIKFRTMSDESTPEDDGDRSPGWNLRGRRHPDAGRRKGQTNKVTREFKAIVQDLIDENADNVRVWLDTVANGKPGVYQTNDEGLRETVQYPVVADPGKAVDLISKLAEYVAPKLTRTEVTGPGGQPLAPPVLNVTIEGHPSELPLVQVVEDKPK